MSAVINQELRATGIARVIVVLKPSAAAATTSRVEKFFVSSEASQGRAIAATSGRATAPAVRHYPNLNIMYGTVTREGLAALRSDKDAVASVSGAPVLSLIWPQRVAAAKLTQTVTWGIDELEVPKLWSQGLTGEGVLVGHLDTGADGKHPALKTAIADFAEFDMLGREVRPKPRAHDTDEHGTHTAATIAGRAVQGRSVGVAPKARLASAIVIEGGDVVARVLGGMDWAVGKQVRILSMSLGFRGWWADFLPLTQLLRQRNILPIFAVGNEGPGTSRSPGNYVQALSVGAVDRQQKVPAFSSSQRFVRTRDPIVPDLVAPGVDVISARPGGGFQLMDGTSMATPHVAGLAALLWQAKPAASANEIERAIFRSCRRPTGMSKDRVNRGFCNGPRALAELV